MGSLYIYICIYMNNHYFDPDLHEAPTADLHEAPLQLGTTMVP